MTHRPKPDEYPPYYAPYVEQVTGDDLLAALENEVQQSLPLLRSVTEAQADHRYAPGKWSVKEVLGHVIDAERVFAYRALTIARGDATPQPGFDEGDYVRSSGSGARGMSELIMEFELLRLANVAFFRGLPAEAWDRKGIANGVSFTVRSLAAIIAGHGAHHVRILRERYLS